MTQFDPAPQPTPEDDYLGEALGDAERLVKYAAEVGIEVDPEIRTAILDARAGYPNQGTDVSAKLLSALTGLTVRLRPITAESIKVTKKDTKSTFRRYSGVSIVLAVIIIVYSSASFVSSSIAKALTLDIAKANDLAVKLHAKLGVTAPSSKAGAASRISPLDSDTEVITELQDYASTIRLIYARSMELNKLILGKETIPFRAEQSPRCSLPANANTSELNPTKEEQDEVLQENKRRCLFEITPGIPDLYGDRNRLTGTFQEVRNFAQVVIDDGSVFYGAVATCILPALYAILGTCAYLLRTFEDQMSDRTFVPSIAHTARFLIAAIGGTVVGLFSNNFTIAQGASISPLALAFVVGYAVDVFFAFLEGLIKPFSKSTTPPLSPATITVAKP